MLWQTSNLYKFGSHFVTSIYWLLGGVVGGATGAVARVTGWEGKFGGCCPGWENTELDGDVAGGGGCGEDAVDGESFVNCVWADALARNSAARNCSKWNCCRSWNDSHSRYSILLAHLQQSWSHVSHRRAFGSHLGALWTDFAICNVGKLIHCSRQTRNYREPLFVLLWPLQQVLHLFSLLFLVILGRLWPWSAVPSCFISDL